MLTRLFVQRKGRTRLMNLTAILWVLKDRQRQCLKLKVISSQMHRLSLIATKSPWPGWRGVLPYLTPWHPANCLYGIFLLWLRMTESSGGHLELIERQLPCNSPSILFFLTARGSDSHWMTYNNKVTRTSCLEKKKKKQLQSVVMRGDKRLLF